MITPDDFITAIRNSDSYIECIYMNGGCYQFYKILKLLFPQAEPFKVKMKSFNNYNHVIAKIDGRYYDITGEIKPSQFADMDAIYEEDIKELEKWSFGYNNWLYRCCPECGAEVIA